MNPDRKASCLGRLVDEQHDVPAVVWLGLPAGALAIMLGSPLMGPELWEAFLTSEFGFLEIATLVMLLTAIGIGIIAISTPKARTIRWLRPILVLAVLAAVYFAGEEASWGQHYLGFETPETWSELNSQKEFNFHNLVLTDADILDNVPRLGMLLACLILGVILPVIRYCRGESAYDPEYPLLGWIIPSPALVPVALMAVLSTVPEKVFELTYADLSEIPPDSWATMALYTPAGEFKEFAFAMVFLIGFASLHRRLMTADG